MVHTRVGTGRSRSARAVTLERTRVPPFEVLAERLARGTAVADRVTRERVAAILAAVKEDGDAALRRFQRELDGTDLAPEAWEIPRERWEEARARLPAPLGAALERAAARIRRFHEQQREESFATIEEDGTRLGMRVVPLDAVGVYVPGGRAAYPSTVLMNVIPARVAGVREVIAVTPPAGITDAVLAACAIAGVTRLFRVGGAQACAALAFGTATIPRVDKVVGPGNRWVAEAKRQLAGLVGIDMIAGPTEVLVIADDAADPVHVAADLIAQAEHDTDATAWLVTTAEPLVDAVDRELVRQLDRAPRAAVAARALQANGLAVLVPDLETAVEVANRKAPEHLELLVREPERLLDGVRHAGAVFLGDASPEPVGDYLAGPSHVLPTGGTARFASPLGVYDFVRRMSVIAYSPARLAGDADHIIALAEAEGLPGHAEAIRRRRDD